MRTSIEGKNPIPNVAIFIKRTAVEFIQVIFGARAVGSLHYDEDDSKTEIFIADQHTTNIKAVEVNPAIIAVRGPISWLPTGLGGGSFEGQNMPTGKTTFNDLLSGSVAFSCLSREGIEAENIAHLVFNSFKFFRPILQQYGYFSIKSMNVGSEALIEQEGSDDKLYLVPVYISVQVQDRWTLSDDAARNLRKIVIETLTTPVGD
jgi:hypothetical protein